MNADDARQRLRQWRADQGLTQVDAAKLLGCDPTYIGMLEREENPRTPGLRVANALHAVVGIPTTAWHATEADDVA